jgi:hypothetical protein
VLDLVWLHHRYRSGLAAAAAAVIIIIKLPDQAIASMPSAPPPPPGRKKEGAPLHYVKQTLQLLRTSQAFTRYAAMLLDTSRQTPLLPQTLSETKRNNLVDASVNDNTLRNFPAPPAVAKQTESHPT